MISEENCIRIARVMFHECFEEQCKAYSSIRYIMKGIKAIRVLRENPPKHCSDMFRVEVEYKSVWMFDEGKWVPHLPGARPVNLSGHIIVVQRDDIKQTAHQIGEAMRKVFCANVLILRIYTFTDRGGREEAKVTLRNNGVHLFFADELSR